LRLVEHGPFAVVMLGGVNDLTDSASRFTGGRCEYLRVMTKRLKELSGR